MLDPGEAGPKSGADAPAAAYAMGGAAGIAIGAAGIAMGAHGAAGIVMGGAAAIVMGGAAGITMGIGGGVNPAMYTVMLAGFSEASPDLTFSLSAAASSTLCRAGALTSKDFVSASVFLLASAFVN
jgi:hypothetical protein